MLLNNAIEQLMQWIWILLNTGYAILDTYRMSIYLYHLRIQIYYTQSRVTNNNTLYIDGDYKRKRYQADLFGNTSIFNVVYFIPSRSQGFQNNFIYLLTVNRFSL